MKKLRWFFVVLACCAAAPVVRVEGASLTDTQLDAIRTNCVDAQVNMQRLQDSDQVARINRGYLYETTLRLMTSLNSRVAQKKVDQPGLMTITSQYQTAMGDLRVDYTDYDNSLKKLIKLDCRSEPTTFNDMLIDTRSKRTRVAADIRRLDSLATNYQYQVDAVKTLVSGGVQ